MLLQHFVLTDSCPVQITARIRDLHHFKESLDRPVFTVCPVHDRDRHIDRADVLCTEQFCFDRPDDDLVVFADDRDLRALGDRVIQILEGLHFIQKFSAVHFAVFGYINRYNVVFLFIHSADRLVRGNDAYFMFHRLSAEKNSYIQFHKHLSDITRTLY